MNKKDIVVQIKEDLKDKIIFWEGRSPKRHYFMINKDDIVFVARYLFEKRRARFITASGIDTPRGIEILYHFSFDKEKRGILTVKVLVSKQECEIESLTPFITGATFIEREIQELLGVKFLNHPDPRPLLTSEDWPEDKFPLRIDYRDADFTNKVDEEK